MSTDAEWADPTHPPVKDAIDLGGGVWVTWGSVYNHGDQPLIWHWCDRKITRQRDTNRVPEWYKPQWRPAGVEAHTLVSRDPLHLEPSLYWPACCGKHGFIRDGRWEGLS